MLFTSEYSMKMGIGEALLTAVIGIATVLMILAVIALLIMLVSKVIRLIETKTAKAPEAGSTASPTNTPPAAVPLPDTESQGELILENVDEPTAAVIMAIVSNKSGIPLNRLCFKSIKLLEENKNEICSISKR
ncbi:MAG: OadG family protein [Acutalibacteraceae bacterium]